MPSHPQSFANAPVLVDDDTGLAILSIVASGGPTVGVITDENGNILTVKTATFNGAVGAGPNIIVPAVVGKKIRCLGYNFSLVLAASTAGFKEGGGATILSALGQNAIGGEEKAGPGTYLFETAAGNGLEFESGTVTTGSVQLQYVEV